MSVTLREAIEAFLAMGFDEPAKPYRTQRDARDDAMRVLGFSQAQNHLRHFLSQTAEDGDLAKAPYHPNALKPQKFGKGMTGWVAPEFEVKRR